MFERWFLQSDEHKTILITFEHCNMTIIPNPLLRIALFKHVKSWSPHQNISLPSFAPVAALETGVLCRWQFCEIYIRFELVAQRRWSTIARHLKVIWAPIAYLIERITFLEAQNVIPVTKTRWLSSESSTFTNSWKVGDRKYDLRQGSDETFNLNSSKACKI